MAIELTRAREITANESKVDGARLLAVKHTLRSKALQEAYHSVVQVLATSSLTLPTQATNLGQVRYIYLETNDDIDVKLDADNIIRIRPLVLNGLAIFEADLSCTSVTLINNSDVAIKVHVLVAGDLL